MSSQTLQVNGVFKNSELINHQPNKKVYSKPYLFCEKFVPQEFVAICDVPNRNYYFYDIQAIETDNVDGWSSGDLTTYSGNSYFLYFDSNEQYSGLDYKAIHKNDFEGDLDMGVYYEYKLTSPGKLVHKVGNTYERIAYSVPSGTIFYRSSKQKKTSNNSNITIS